MDNPYQPQPDVHVLPFNAVLPGVGVLPINSFVLHAEQPMLVDTGVGADAGDFADAVASIVPLDQLRWIWITHDDADHVGSIQRLMELAPQVRVATHGMCALRMALTWPLALDRVHAIRAGDELDLGDRVVRAVFPPLFDNPISTGFVDTSTGTLFSVDSFGAIIPEAVSDVADIPDEALAGGMTGWATFDSPWTALVDENKFGAVLERVRQLAPTRILSSHLPAAPGDSVERFLSILAAVPQAELPPAPNAEEFQMMAKALMALTAPPDPAVAP